MKAWLTHYRTVIIIVLALTVWGAVFYLVPPEQLVERIGIGNTYAVSFFVTLCAGFSFLTGTAAYATVIEFARGGADSLVLGVVSGIGLFLSDSVFYLLVMRGRETISNKLGPRLKRFGVFMEQLPNAIVYICVYIFCAVGPIPNDAIIAVLIIGGYEYKKLWPALLAGDITFMLFLSYLFQQ